MDIEYIKNTGDNLQDVASDWILNGDDEDLLAEVAKLPSVPKYTSILNQYADKDWYTSCTKFAPMNGLWNDMQFKPTVSDIKRVEQKSLDYGWKGPGFGRARGSGVYVIYKDWNERNPEDTINFAVTSIFSKLFRLYLNQGRGVIVSIRPESSFWADVILDGKLDNADFGIGGGHATCIRKIDGVFRFVDSVGSSKGDWYEGREYTFTEEQLRIMIRNGTFRSDCHIFIPKHIIKMITKDVPEGQYYSEPVKRAIENNITTETEKFRPDDKITRAEAITWLYRLDKKNEGNS